MDVDRINMNRAIGMLAPGLMLHAVSEDEKGNMRPVFIIKEDRKHMDRIKEENPAIEARMFYFLHNNVHALLFMIRVDNDDELIYDVWINVNAPEGYGRDMVKALAEHDDLYLQFYVDGDYTGQSSVSRVICAKNGFKESKKEMLEQALDQEPWTMEEFNEIKDCVYKAHPNWHSLWNIDNSVARGIH